MVLLHNHDRVSELEKGLSENSHYTLFILRPLQSQWFYGEFSSQTHLKCNKYPLENLKTLGKASWKKTLRKSLPMKSRLERALGMPLGESLTISLFWNRLGRITDQSQHWALSRGRDQSTLEKEEPWMSVCSSVCRPPLPSSTYFDVHLIGHWN